MKHFCLQCNIEMNLPSWKVKRGQKFCSKPCAYQGRECKGLFEKGHSDLVPATSRGHTQETINKITKTARDNAEYLVGQNHPNFKHGNRDERKKAMSSYSYREWRTSVFKRDNFICQECNATGVYVEADHIKPWCAFPELRYDINNGRTLCRPCHMKQDTWGIKATKYLENKSE
jgi:hypothetical protein